MSSFPEQGPHPEQAGFPAAGAHIAQVYGGVDLAEASRQLELAAHDIAVAASCIGLGDLDEAHTNVITARAAADAAEEILRVVLGSGLGSPL
jgi:hypothetical protein